MLPANALGVAVKNARYKKKKTIVAIKDNLVEEFLKQISTV